MSEKRFTFLTGASGVLFYDNEVMMPYPVVVDLLNSQSDALLSYDKLVNDLKEENEQLRHVKNNCRKQQVQQANTIHKLIEENEQLKIANAKWLDKSLQDKQIQYDDELVRRYLQLNEEIKNE